MAYRYFRGKINLEKLPLSDLAKATEALAILEQLAAESKIGFEMGVARTRREKKQAGRTIQPQERAMLDVMSESDWMSAKEIAKAMPEVAGNSITARLAMMAAYGWVEVSRVERTGGGVGRRAIKVYRRPRAAG